MIPVVDSIIFSDVIESLSPEETYNIGLELSRTLNSGDIIALAGDLGAGKTVIVQGICSGLNISGPVISPTFTLLNEYRGVVPIFHFDAYRLSSTKDFLAIGYEDYLLRDGICIIEWADKIEEIIPKESIWVRISHLDSNENGRMVKIDLPDKDKD